jgi:diacylglycerol kinase (ATP)
MPRKFIKSFKYAHAGASHAIRTQRNLWIHFAAGILVLCLALFLKVPRTELSILILAIFGVIVAEMVNTALEAMVDILSPEFRAEAALAKNVAAAAVLLAAMGALIIGGLIFMPRLM